MPLELTKGNSCKLLVIFVFAFSIFFIFVFQSKLNSEASEQDYFYVNYHNDPGYSAVISLKKKMFIIVCLHCVFMFIVCLSI